MVVYNVNEASHQSFEPGARQQSRLYLPVMTSTPQDIYMYDIWYVYSLSPRRVAF